MPSIKRPREEVTRGPACGGRTQPALGWPYRSPLRRRQSVLKIRKFAAQVENRRGGSKQNLVSARSGEGVRIHSLRKGKKRTAARNFLLFGLPENLPDVVSISYHVNHEIIGRVEMKVHAHFATMCSAVHAWNG